MVETETKDWLTPVAIGVGGLALATGLYFAFRKPPGVPPGGSFEVTFSFDYLGGSGDYILQVHLGKLWLGIFDHIPGLGWYQEVNLPGADHYEFSLVCDLPLGIAAGTYDGEGGIRLPGAWDPPYDYIAGPLHQKGAIIVAKET